MLEIWVQIGLKFEIGQNVVHAYVRSKQKVVYEVDHNGRECRKYKIFNS